MNEYKNTEVSQLQYTLKDNTDPMAAYGRIHVFYTTDKDGKTPDNLGSVQIEHLSLRTQVLVYGSTERSGLLRKSYARNSVKRASLSSVHQVITTSLHVNATILLLM